jgi:hypothetical protein
MRKTREVDGETLPLLTGEEQAVLNALFKAHTTTDAETVEYLQSFVEEGMSGEDLITETRHIALFLDTTITKPWLAFCNTEMLKGGAAWTELQGALRVVRGFDNILRHFRAEQMDDDGNITPDVNVDDDGLEVMNHLVDYPCMHDRKWLAAEVEAAAVLRRHHRGDADGATAALIARYQGKHDAAPAGDCATPIDCVTLSGAAASPSSDAADGAVPTKPIGERAPAFIETTVEETLRAPLRPHSLLRQSDRHWYYRETPGTNGARPVRAWCTMCDEEKGPHLMWREVGGVEVKCSQCKTAVPKGEFAWVCPNGFLFSDEKVLCRTCEFGAFNHRFNIVLHIVREGEQPGVTRHALRGNVGVELVHGTLKVACSGAAEASFTGAGGAAYPIAVVAASHCPRHDKALELAVRDEQYAVRREHPLRFACRCAGRTSLETLCGAEKDECSAVEFYACPADGCDFAICKPCVSASLGAAAVIIAALKHKIVATIKAIPIYQIADVFYLPVIELAVATVFCKFPMQCIFQGCYNSLEQRFAIAALFGAFALIVFGAGLILLIADTAQYRKNLIVTENVIDPGRLSRTPLATLLQRLACNMGKADWESITELDQSKAKALYADYEFRWMLLHGPLLLFKCAVVFVIVHMEAGSLGQMYAITSVELLQLVVSLLVSPMQDPWVDVLAKLGFLHQVAQLSCVGYFRHIVYENPRGRDGVPVVMLILSCTYLAALLCILAYAVVVPTVRNALARRKDDAAFEEAERRRRNGEEPFPVDSGGADESPGSGPAANEPFADTATVNSRPADSRDASATKKNVSAKNTVTATNKSKTGEAKNPISAGILTKVAAPPAANDDPGDYEFDSDSGYYWSESAQLYWDEDKDAYYDPVSDKWADADTAAAGTAAAAATAADATAAEDDPGDYELDSDSRYHWSESAQLYWDEDKDAYYDPVTDKWAPNK